MRLNLQQIDSHGTSFPVLIMTSVVIGIGSGLLSAMLVLLLHHIQHLAYNYSLASNLSETSFLQGVSDASSLRRIVVLMICGLIAGLGWWALFRYAKPLVSISQALQTHQKMPIGTTIMHALLQIVTIALGSPLGREVAPRELSAVFVTYLTSKVSFHLKDIRILLACGAGAGLAAVYNVPLSGALFTLEVLLCTYRLSTAILAVVTSITAVGVSWIVLPNTTLYPLTSSFNLDASLLIWSIVAGSTFGIVATWFRKLTSAARQQTQLDWRRIPWCWLNFTCIGLLATVFPALLGNGKSLIYIELHDTPSIMLSTTLFILKLMIVCTSLRAGAYGGLLMPSLASGALLAGVFNAIFYHLGHHLPTDITTLLGASAFLAVSQNMPITAMVLMFEFTHAPSYFVIPLGCTVLSAIITAKMYQQKSLSNHNK